MNVIIAVNIKTKMELTFVDVSPTHAAQYGAAEDANLLSWFFEATQEEKDSKFPTKPNGNAIECGDWLAMDKADMDTYDQDPDRYGSAEHQMFGDAYLYRDLPNGGN